MYRTVVLVTLWINARIKKIKASFLFPQDRRQHTIVSKTLWLETPLRSVETNYSRPFIIWNPSILGEVPFVSRLFKKSSKCSCRSCFSLVAFSTPCVVRKPLILSQIYNAQEKEAFMLSLGGGGGHLTWSIAWTDKSHRWGHERVMDDSALCLCCKMESAYASNTFV